jgi:hypothetical protein
MRSSVSRTWDDDEDRGNFQADQLRSEDDPEDHSIFQHKTTYSPSTILSRFESETHEQAEPFEATSYYHDRCRDDFEVEDFNLTTDFRKESLVATADNERQRRAANTIQESFRRKRYQRCLKRPMLANRLLFDAHLARGARRLLIHLATFAAYLASLDLSSNGIAK